MNKENEEEKEDNPKDNDLWNFKNLNIRIPLL